MAYDNFEPGPWDEPGDLPPPLGEPMHPAHNRFRLEPFASIQPNLAEEWLIKKLLPARGVTAVFGKPGSLKSFVALDMALHIALGSPWAGRRVTQAPAVYIAAEGAGGLRKRIGGAKIAKALPADAPFYLVETAPNLGTGEGDRLALIEAITAQGVAPGVVVLDTLAQSLGGADENASGMTQFVANAMAIAAYFGCVVLVVHHSGLADSTRMRGHSSLLGAVDAALLCEKTEGALEARLTLQKSKDDACGGQLLARLSSVEVGVDADGDSVTTLVVDTVQDAEPVNRVTARVIPRGERLLMAVIEEAIAEAGQNIPASPDGPNVRAVSEDALRRRFYTRLAEQADPDEDAGKLAERQRKTFSRALTPAIRAQAIIAREYSERRFLWLP